MRWAAVKDMRCSVARTLSVVGERWTMLILREAFLGRHRFDEFQQGTGIARNILSSRLRDLVEKGIFERARADGEQGRVEYRLTEKGLDLYPVLIALMRWGDTWLCDETGPPLTLVHRNCGATTAPTMVCSECGEHLAAREVVAVPQKTAHRARREARIDRKRAPG
ncbi:MAG: helix-turn-helix domain-containing protein [Candidatus Binatus sp.]|uniref:winged helix-turn-helix transcriptional regulator n=1 Tax=Candidatus Binatus sp. TaxID=2811406 RepID=UPI00271F12EA|nr:helix-turn-helix domain-containing protein [Candidatus Binatus sp.]MDO8433078.1 helix-turn-helix domain-containing protein [Candidatus Binatus sp.]